MPIDPSQHRNVAPLTNLSDEEEYTESNKEEPRLDEEGNPVDHKKFDVDKVDELEKTKNESEDKKEDK